MPARTRAIRFALIAAIVACGGAIAVGWTQTIAEDHERLIDATLDDVKVVATRHPLDYLAYARGSELTVRTNPALSIALINHSMRLHPSHPGLHRLAARLLLARGRTAQAAVEYRLAMRGTLFPAPLLREIVTRLPGADLAAGAIPDDWRPVDPVLLALAEMDRSDVAIAWLRWIVEQPQVDTSLIDRLYDLALMHNDLESAVFAARRRVATANTGSSRWMLAQLELKRKNYGEVLRILADVASWRSRVDEQSQAWLLLCQAHRELGHVDEAIQCLRGLERSGVLMPINTGRVLELRTELEDQKNAANRLQALDPDAKLEVLEPARPSLPPPH